MSDHVETLRWELRVRREREQQHGETVSGQRMIAALTAAIEALEGREWKDAPSEDGGLHWALWPDGEQQVVDVFPIDDTWHVQEMDGTIVKLDDTEKGSLWSRLPDPPPVPESEGD